MKPVIAAMALAMALPQAAWADRALFLVNDRFETLRNVPIMRRVARALDDWEDLGFEVVEGQNLTLAEMAEALDTTVQGLEPGEPLLIVLAGHVVRSGSGGWFLSSDASDPTLGTLAAQAMSLDLVMDVAAEAAGQAVVAVATTPSDRLTLGSGLSRDLADLDVPSGVTLVIGPGRAIAGFVTDDLTRPGAVVADLLAEADGIEGYGFLPRSIPFLPEERDVPEEVTVVTPPPLQPVEEGDGELEFWVAVRELDTEAAYQTYLDRYPEGRFVAAARTRVSALEETPEERAEGIEDALQLSRAQRQEIQRDLAILDYDTRGIDGIFGPGTRGAIRAWQGENGFVQTSYLTEEQIARLESQAAIRAAELEEQARQERLAEERRDRAFWRQTGQAGDEEGLRAYLDEFPDGLFADVARARLEEIEAAQRAQAEAQQREYWDVIRAEDTVGAYREYLDRFPDGPFAGAAAARIAELQQQTDIVARAQAEEDALNLPGFTRVLVERTLNDLGYRPGLVDGNFDANTRAAIRGYQNDRQLTATGYLTQQTVVRLLAGGIGRIVQ